MYPSLKDDHRMIPNSCWYIFQPQAHHSSPFCCLMMPESIFWVSFRERLLTDLLPPALSSVTPACFLPCTSVYKLFLFGCFFFPSGSCTYRGHSSINKDLSHLLAHPTDNCNASIIRYYTLYILYPLLSLRNLHSLLAVSA